MVNQVSTPAPVCPVCKKKLLRMGEPTILEGLPKTAVRNTLRLDYYACNHCRKDMNRYCFVFHRGIVYVFSDHKSWEELETIVNPSRRNSYEPK